MAAVATWTWLKLALVLALNPLYKDPALHLISDLGTVSETRDLPTHGVQNQTLALSSNLALAPVLNFIFIVTFSCSFIFGFSCPFSFSCIFIFILIFKFRVCLLPRRLEYGDGGNTLDVWVSAHRHHHRRHRQPAVASRYLPPRTAAPHLSWSGWMMKIHLRWAGKAAAVPRSPQTIRREKLYDQHTLPANEEAALTASAARSAGSCRKVITEQLIMTRRKLAS